MIYSVDIRNAVRVNGSSGLPPVEVKTTTEAADWFAAREWAAHEYSIDVFDPAMIVTVASEGAVPK